tara:strand:+ start:549 stop:1658 length:1110 start_codon:yes stop_codon:yes gene_type:complete
MKNSHKVIILLGSFSLIFLSGIFVTVSEVFPFTLLKSINNEFNKKSSIISYEPNDVSSLIHVTNIKLVDETRNNLNLFLWKDENLPNRLPSNIENSFSDDRYFEIKNLESIKKITINMDYNINSIAYLFQPTIDNNKIIIYHQGHSGDFFEGKSTIEYFLKKNYSVIAFSMPLLGMNNQPIIQHPQFGEIKMQSHNQLPLLKNSNFSPIKFFVEPVIVALNYLEKHHNFDAYYMIGISGGGWSTTLVSAIDDRVNQSYSIAGSYPIFLRSDPKNFGDYEQHDLDFYQVANYLDLYVMSSIGNDRKHIQIFNKFDPCCFDGDAFLSYEQEIKDIVNSFNDGFFEIYLDDTHKEHIISEHALEIIINEIIS